MSRGNLIVGVDIGTTKVAVIVGEVDEAGVDVIGVGTYPTKGLRKGVVIDVESTVDAIQRAVEEAEVQSRTTIHTVWVGITGGHVKSMTSHGVAALKNGVVRKKDLELVMEAARAVVLPDDREVIHVLPCEYKVDGLEETEPIDQPGIRLEVNCHVVTGKLASINNLTHVCEEAGLTVEGFVFEPVASSYAVVLPTERERGVILMDMGGGTLDIVVLQKGSVIYSTVVSMGGYHITAEIAKTLKVPDSPTAELLKRRHGVAIAEMAGNEEFEAAVPGAREPRLIPQHLLAEIIEYKMEKVLQLARADLESADYLFEAESIVFTGGCSMLPGVDVLAERVFEMPCRIGKPAGVGGRIAEVGTPIFATGVGLVLHAVRDLTGGDRKLKVSGKAVVERMKEWFEDFF
jgi:cell division protein FtsA